MYGMLTANNFRLCRIQPPGAAPELSRFGNSSVFLFSSKTSAVRGSEAEQGKPRRRTVSGYHTVSGTVLTAMQPVTRLLNPKGTVLIKGERARAMPGQQHLIEGGPAAQCFIRADA
jgi:hypothetical protein